MTTNVSISLYTNCLYGENVVVVTTQRQVSYTITGRSNTVQRWFYMYATTRGPIVVSTYTYILSFSGFIDSINTLGTIMHFLNRYNLSSPSYVFVMFLSCVTILHYQLSVHHTTTALYFLTSLKSWSLFHRLNIVSSSFSHLARVNTTKIKPSLAPSLPPTPSGWADWPTEIKTRAQWNSVSVRINCAPTTCTCCSM